MFKAAVVIVACVEMLMLSGSLAQADDWRLPRKPSGVYAKVSIEDAIAGYTGPPSPTPTVLHTYLHKLYAELLADSALSGLTVGAHWDHIQVSEGFCFHDGSCLFGSDGYDWSYLDDAFEEARAAHKSVQLIITPGVDSPSWLLDKIASCDTLFVTGSAANDCGKVTFVDFPEAQRADGMPPEFPLPWNRLYNEAWWDFLAHLNARYRDEAAFVSIAVAGPIGASDEMILPTTGNGSSQLSGLPADDAWAALIQHSFPNHGSYQRTDQVFIDAWKLTIDAYERIFSSITLFLGPDAGNDLPQFKDNATLPSHHDNGLFAVDCSDAIAALPKVSDYRSCEAKTEVLSYFARVEGPSAKATQVGGLTASSPVVTGDVGLAGVKLLTASTSFLGGAEFDHPVSGTHNETQEVGCPDPSGCTLTVEEAAYNVLTAFFSGTPAATFYGGAAGAARMDYLDVPYVDVQYAETHSCPTTPSAVIGKVSLQDLLNRASHDLLGMAGRYVPPPINTCRERERHPR